MFVFKNSSKRDWKLGHQETQSLRLLHLDGSIRLLDGSIRSADGSIGFLDRLICLLNRSICLLNRSICFLDGSICFLDGSIIPHATQLLRIAIAAPSEFHSASIVPNGRARSQLMAERDHNSTFQN